MGLGPGLDARAVALPALARFGFGFLEVGPVTLAGTAGASPMDRRIGEEALWAPDPPESLSLAAAAPRVAEAARLGLPVIVPLWWAMLLSGSSAYAAALGIHCTLGYMSLFHLLPVFVGWGVLLLGLGLSHSYLSRTADAPSSARMARALSGRRL